jgi:hypothetical protein
MVFAAQYSLLSSLGCSSKFENTAACCNYAFYDPVSQRQRGTEDAREENKTVHDMGARAWAGTELVEGDHACAGDGDGDGDRDDFGARRTVLRASLS